ncbi:hypothetical protein GCM10010215_74300 [Streptomyces virginiae]|uniref:Uncharacterized protein n=1 Tax=Streptomyces virginiae TaxID=1961 RepID=A0ABQ3NXP3_STRVG|nr:hypothetical protein GCM10010215_74300 [Streptomyces virginiae]GHI17549.1 hypothetical protein Scinn_70120 [Streptomyces virginiae]GLV91456.1 hypothetical protein Slala04_29100 [Streptomyces lavendulae subsp. lavendulae]
MPAFFVGEPWGYGQDAQLGSGLRMGCEVARIYLLLHLAPLSVIFPVGSALLDKECRGESDDRAQECSDEG